MTKEELIDLYLEANPHFSAWGVGEMRDLLKSFAEELQGQQPSLPEGLDEAAEDAMPEPHDFLEIDIYGGSESVYSREQMLGMYRAGAEWMAEQMPMPEDTVLFNKGVAEGKRLMMEDVVEGKAINTIVNAGLTWLDIQTIIAIYEQGVECGEYRRYNEAEWMKVYSQDILRRFNKTKEDEQ